MDQDYGSNVPLRGGIPRLSRLPMPRASASMDNLKLSTRTSGLAGGHQDDLRKTSGLPRPSGLAGPLGENLNQSIRSRFAWTAKPRNPRSASPVRDALRDAYTGTLETTPPNPKADPAVFEDGSENPTTARTGVLEKRKPRPSLSERTTETLSQVSPCPSPMPRRTSLVNNDSSMLPPLRPTSRASRPTTPATPRAESPSKRAFRPPGRASPTKDAAQLPLVVSPGDIYTPPRAFVRGQRSRIAKPLRDPRRSVSSALESPATTEDSLSSVMTSSQTMKGKPVYSSKTIASHTSAQKPSLSSTFQDSPISYRESKPLSSVSGSKPLVSKVKSKTMSETNSGKERERHPGSAQETSAMSSPKSSAALRETIAKAKAARRDMLRKSGEAARQSNDFSTGFGLPDDLPSTGDNSGLLKKRIQQAVTTGQLNIAGMNLKRIPTEIMKMYDPEDNKIDWSEMIDLTKMNAADNEIEELLDEMFPDYSESELQNDDEKSNQFGGIESIDFHRNKIQRLPIGFRSLTRLQSLNLTGNKLGMDAFDILRELPQLKELFLGENLFNGSLLLDQCDFQDLQVLDLHGNNIENIEEQSLLHMKGLKRLDLSANKLSRLPWKTLASLALTELNVSKNRLSGMLICSASCLPELRSLNASYNDLEGVCKDDLDLPNLRTLILNGNRMAKLPSLAKCKQLQTLTVAENQLDELPTQFAHLEGLASADFAHNNIRLVDPEISRMTKLSGLNLAGNPLREKKYLTMSTAELKLALEKKLEDTSPAPGLLDDSSKPTREYRFKASNGILDMSSQSLSAVDLSEIHLDDSNGPIRALKLSNNDLTTFPVDLLNQPVLKYSLQVLDLSHNPSLHSTEYLTSELFLPNLKSLYIVSTGLTSLDALTTYLKAPCLVELNISCHRLTGRVPWVRAWWPTCTTLLATDNWFSSVDVEGVRGLEVLDIRNNEIETLPPKIGLLGKKPGSVREAGKLHSLEVSGNKFRVPRLGIVEKGTEAILKDLRRMIALDEIPEEWQEFA
ncbi:hypothetical protein PV08_09069 [Exophiala spinifera]|uniref:Leucine-rich repeat-containing protein 40 n=1 Tax=Exophiala spinifera TaxID=91928 RepID=A0A0D1ZFM0_9EURO|nr:uncharacterized protein PV08_09069 [Exophiala spinifera]KIW11797.1 hypothetical protein PV08_09069 [Exophiala spinifera]